MGLFSTFFTKTKATPPAAILALPEALPPPEVRTRDFGLPSKDLRLAEVEAARIEAEAELLKIQSRRPAPMDVEQTPPVQVPDGRDELIASQERDIEVLVKEVEELRVRADESENWMTVGKVCLLYAKKYGFNSDYESQGKLSAQLRRISDSMGVRCEKVFKPWAPGAVNSYHRSVVDKFLSTFKK